MFLYLRTLVVCQIVALLEYAVASARQAYGSPRGKYEKQDP